MKITLLVLLLLSSGCSNLLYYPTRYRHIDTELLKYPPEEIVFYEDKEKKEHLMGWYFKSPQKKPKGLFFFFHGNAQNVSTHFVSLYWALEEGYDYFVFDYPGYGGSYGEPNPQNTAESGLRAIEFARKKWPNLPIIIFGQSIGGAISMQSMVSLADRSRICAHIVESTFSSYKKAGQKAMASSFWTWVLQPFAYISLSDEFAPKGKIDQISPIPLLVVHRKNDRIVSYSLGQKVFEEAKQPKDILTLEGEGHIDAFTAHDRVENRKKLLSFLQVCQK